MSLPPSELEADAITSFKAVTISCTALHLYYSVLHFDEEIEYIWIGYTRHPPYSVEEHAFSTTRERGFIPFLENCLNGHLFTGLGPMVMLLAEVILMMRVYALYGGAKRILIAFTVITLALFAVNILQLSDILNEIDLIGGPAGFIIQGDSSSCVLAIPMSPIAWSIASFVELLLLLLVILKMAELKTLKKPLHVSRGDTLQTQDITATMARDSILYFAMVYFNFVILPVDATAYIAAFTAVPTVVILPFVLLLNGLVVAIGHTSESPHLLAIDNDSCCSYEVDPTYQRKFSIVWASIAAFFVLVALPTFVQSVRAGRVWDALAGVREELNTYEPLRAEKQKAVQHKERKLTGKTYNTLSACKAFTMWTTPIIGLDLGQVILVVGYYITILLCITLNSELIDNPNRAGFLAIAQLPPVFLFATKNSPLAILLSSGYEKLNFLHRWCSRGVVLAAAVHGSLWIRNHLQYDLQILGAQKETSGVATFAMLCILGITSVRPVRSQMYQVFRLIHLLAAPAFFVTLCYHTIYAPPYIYPPLAFYGFDLFLRLVRFRFKDATLVAPDAHMTIVRIHDCTSGWSAGQHVRLRVFIANRMFESHPLTIMNAPRSITCLDTSMSRELLLGARVCGDWTRALNSYVQTYGIVEKAKGVSGEDPKPSVVTVQSEVVVEGRQDGDLVKTPPSKIVDTEESVIVEQLDWMPAGVSAPVQVLLDGPYGGCPLDLGTFECVFLVAGGSGMTFTLGLLDELVGRCVRLGRHDGEVTRRIEFVWYIRSFGALHWIAPLLSTIASRAGEPESSLDLHISVYVTCLCNPEDVPPIPNCDVLLEKPSIGRVVEGFVSPSVPMYDNESHDSNEKEKTTKGNSVWSSLAICAAGPESLTAEAKNAAARLALRSSTRKVECHTETYFL
ncbi:uncharacterized protein FOMMEDRAFT_145758 [Fomitiporia mediterranea MF3/22]|uniref:uncharacterized protein n=1 Tax=Fomitiporia mediterranea (strain MF3/22) TaxID=694068 RepID=UPI0004407D23|nr:uncharacterized protein FOMMEDRAFT_145758 [Fomitiporia mediterranea MF3/22]EJD05206.1 hypothetical protein FOMMEDRAFT_145758 [Fomitiporia mediterranea MF3/22]